FAVNRRDRVFKQTAPIIKLQKGRGDEACLALVGYLNSSTACFWMKQVMFPKGSTASNRNHPSPEREVYDFSASALVDLPLPSGIERLGSLGAAASALAAQRRLVQGELPLENAWLDAASLRRRLAQRWATSDDLRARLLALQEEIDWAVYSLFGLVPS